MCCNKVVFLCNRNGFKTENGVFKHTTAVLDPRLCTEPIAAAGKGGVVTSWRVGLVEPSLGLFRFHGGLEVQIGAFVLIRCGARCLGTLCMTFLPSPLGPPKRLLVHRVRDGLNWGGKTPCETHHRSLLSQKKINFRPITIWNERASACGIARHQPHAPTWSTCQSVFVVLGFCSRVLQTTSTCFSRKWTHHLHHRHWNPTDMLAKMIT